MSKPADLVQGTLDLLLLKIVALEPLHAWAISQRLKQVSGEVLHVSDGSLYPALHKLEQEGWIKAEWKVTENGRRAKFYSLTRPGRQALERESANWERLAGAISQVVRLSPPIRSPDDCGDGGRANASGAAGQLAARSAGDAGGPGGNTAL
jgi:PadR family transcriptional regulator, regulatory protein PadR